SVSWHPLLARRPRGPITLRGAPGSTASAVREELAPRAGELRECRSRREADAKSFLVGSEALYDVLGAQRVRVAERAAPERRPAQTVDGADVSVARGADDLLAQTVRCLVHHLQHAPLGDLVARRR